MRTLLKAGLIAGRAGGAGPTPPAAGNIIDTFTDVDDTLIQNHTPDSSPGSSWVRHTMPGGVTSNSAMYLTGNQLRFRTAASQGANINSGLSNDISVEVDLNLNAATSFNVGLILRYVDANNFLCVRVRSSADIIELLDVTAGSFTVIVDAAFTWASNTNYTLLATLDSNNNQVAVSVNDVGLLSSTFVTQHAAGTRQGVGIFGGTEFRPSLDEFRVINLL